MAKKNMKKFISLTLAALLICATLPLGTLAAGPENGEGDSQDVMTSEVETVDTASAGEAADEATAPAAEDPEPVEPEPEAPTPVEPEPVEPAPVDPEPAESEPVEEEPAEGEPEEGWLVIPVPEETEPEGEQGVALILNSNNSIVDSWDVTSDGSNVTITFSGVSSSNPWWAYLECDVSYGGVKDGNFAFTLSPGNSSIEVNYVKNWNTTGVSGVVKTMKGDSSGKYTATVSVPLSFFGNKDFTLSFCGTTVSSTDILGGSSEPEPEATPEPFVGETIVVDGDLSEWRNIGGYAGGASASDHSYEGWKVARDAAGNLYLCAWGTINSQWVQPQWGTITITQNGSSSNLQFANLSGMGGQFVFVSEANGNTPGPLYVEAMIPASYLKDPNFVISFGGDGVPASQIPEWTPPEPEEDDPVYTGIVIDGEYHDWDAVTKHPASDDRNTNGVNNLESAAMVFDGDMVYIYLKERPGGHASGAGSHGNGQFAITTDLGKILLIQLTREDTVAGIDGATAAHVGSQWEIAIPASALPEYLESISFGLYMQEPPFVSDVVNLDGSNGGGDFDGIVYDGNYRDWDYYPHTLIEYATAGTHEHVDDAEGALWADGGTLYGHFYSTMPQHLELGVQELTEAITIDFNGHLFYPAMFTRNSDGSINWSPDRYTNEPGTYEFDISWTADSHYAGTRMDDPNYTGKLDAGKYNSDWCYGRMFVTVTEDKIECEFFIDLEVVAERMGVDASDFKEIKAQFGRLGQQWVTIAGTSSGAWLGVELSIAAVAVVLLWRRKKYGTPAEAEG